jgi:Right handed beta helix region
MIKRLRSFLMTGLFVGILTAAGFTSAAELIALDRDNIAVTQSVRVKPGVYTVKDADGNGVLRVEQDGVDLDFQGATLQSADPRMLDLTRAEGIGIFLDGHKNVTIRNAKVHGYLFNIKALRASGLKVENCDVSYSRAHRIASGGSPIEIWLVLRSLEAWRSYGGGIWIESSPDSTVRSCRGTGAQNGLLPLALS